MSFYVTALKGGRNDIVAFLMGPYETLEQAQGKVADGRHLVRWAKADPFAELAYGVSKYTGPKGAEPIAVFGKTSD